MDLMKDIPDKSIDLVLCDPPYGIGLDYNSYIDTEENWFNLINSVVPEMMRVAHMVIMPCCRIVQLPWIYKNHTPDWLICWYKGSPGYRSFIGFNDWEPLLVYGKTKNLHMHDFMSCANYEKMGNYGHPCPKPVTWAKWLIKRASKPNDLVLDPMCGSGTTAIACYDLGRNFICIEKDPEYYKAACKRLEDHKKLIKQKERFGVYEM